MPQIVEPEIRYPGRLEDHSEGPVDLDRIQRLSLVMKCMAAEVLDF
jgi:hypothetical protein